MKKRKPLGVRIAQLSKVDGEIALAEKIVRELKQQRAKLEARLLKEFQKEEIDGTKLKGKGTARIRKTTFFSIADRRKFNKYVLRHKALDLFQNRISATAYKARLEEGEAVPGVGKFERVSISITGVKR